MMICSRRTDLHESAGAFSCAGEWNSTIENATTQELAQDQQNLNKVSNEVQASLLPLAPL